MADEKNNQAAPGDSTTTTTSQSSTTAPVSRPNFRERIGSSASKIVFIGMGATSCVAYLIGRMETEQFILLAGMAFSFYFSHKGEPGVPYAAK